jgi:N-acetylglucosaminyldiphosphoundecaprenol N-acetyl-beta-D-mannosaminyltransferase
MRNGVLVPAPHDVLGVPVHPLTMAQALDVVDWAVRSRARLRIGVVNAAKIVNMRRDTLLQKDVLSCDLILADGMAVVWAARVLGCHLPERVAGIDMMLGMFERGNQHGYRVYCLGATDDVLTEVVRRLAEKYPQIQVVGKRNGYFSAADEKQVAAEIRAARPDILLVAMTSPKKEKFLARWSAHLGVAVCQGVGGSFDVFAGKVQRAPRMWQSLGLEWLYRVKQEPRRLWKRYLVTNTLFCSLVLREFVRHLPQAIAR